MTQRYFTDLRLELDDAAQVRETSDGYLVAMPRVARTGIQLYLGSEVGVTDKKVVRIYRPETEVFAQDSLASYAGKPVTDDHPPQMVDAGNWRDHSRGVVGNEILRDGEWVRVPFIMMDKGLIKKFRDGKKQISMGYLCDVDMTPGTTPQGEQYDGIQKTIRINHAAIVSSARAGSKAVFGDSANAAKVFDGLNKALDAIREGRVVRDKALEGAGQGLLDGAYPFMKDGSVYLVSLRDAQAKAKEAGDEDIVSSLGVILGQVKDSTPAKEVSMKTMVIDGITCEMSETAAQVVARALDQHASTIKGLQQKSTDDAAAHATALKAANDQVAKLTTDLATATAKVATLETQVKDAELTPAKLDQLVKDRALVADKAKTMLPTVVIDGKTVDEIMKQVVEAKIGDAAKAWDANMVKVSFDTLTASLKPVDHARAGLDATRQAFSVTPQGDQRADLYAKRDAALSEAWKTPAGQA